MSKDTELAPCPRCGKPDAEMRDAGRGRFRVYVLCEACAFMTEPARTQGIAAKLWNEAKPAQNGKPTSSKKARTRRA